MIPQIIMVALISGGLFRSLAKHGEPRENNYNFGWELIGTIIEVAILYWGGFWDVFKT